MEQLIFTTTNVDSVNMDNNTNRYCINRVQFGIKTATLLFMMTFTFRTVVMSPPIVNIITTIWYYQDWSVPTIAERIGILPTCQSYDFKLY